MVRKKSHQTRKFNVAAITLQAERSTGEPPGTNNLCDGDHTFGAPYFWVFGGFFGEELHLAAWIPSVPRINSTQLPLSSLSGI